MLTKVLAIITCSGVNCIVLAERSYCIWQ